jgi:hypothetical protein
VQTGAYQVQASLPGQRGAAQSAGFTIADSGLEALDTSAQPQTLQALTNATGGECLAIDQSAKLIEAVHKLRLAEQPDRTLAYVFDQPWVFAVVVIALGAEWWLRRRWGLL